LYPGSLPPDNDLRKIHPAPLRLQAAACRATVGYRILISCGCRPSRSSHRSNGWTAPSCATKFWTTLLRGRYYPAAPMQRRVSATV